MRDKCYCLIDLCSVLPATVLKTLLETFNRARRDLLKNSDPKLQVTLTYSIQLSVTARRQLVENNPRNSELLLRVGMLRSVDNNITEFGVLYGIIHTYIHIVHQIAVFTTGKLGPFV